MDLDERKMIIRRKEVIERKMTILRNNMIKINKAYDLYINVSRRALNIMGAILSTYYKCTFSAVTHKLNVSGHM
jgi:hypothetical protein